jgi:hypothetical protein
MEEGLQAGLYRALVGKIYRLTNAQDGCALKKIVKKGRGLAKNLLG